MEWAHRILGRVIGISFVLPLAYFVARRKVSKPLAIKLSGMALLIGFQGALGWYMVKSGLEEETFAGGDAVPRVSQYRLAAHLGTALALYFGMLKTALAVFDDLRVTRATLSRSAQSLLHPKVILFKKISWALTGLVFLTALSGL